MARLEAHRQEGHRNVAQHCRTASTTRIERDPAPARRRRSRPAPNAVRICRVICKDPSPRGQMGKSECAEGHLAHLRVHCSTSRCRASSEGSCLGLRRVEHGILRAPLKLPSRAAKSTASGPAHDTTSKVAQPDHAPDSRCNLGAMGSCDCSGAGWMAVEP